MSSDWKHPYQIPFEQSMIVAQAAGYRYLDANLCGFCRKEFKISTLADDHWEESVRNWRSLADQIGVEFKQAHAFFSTNAPLAEAAVPGGAAAFYERIRYG